MKKMLVSATLAVLMALPAASASAEEVEKEVQVSGGSLQVTQTKLQFSDVTLKVRDQQKSFASSLTHVIDNRGNGAGYGYSVSATDFETEVTINGQTQKFKIPASSIRFTTTLKDTITGVPVDFSTNGVLANNEVLSDTPRTMFKVDPGFGQGAYDFQVDYVLNLPQKIQSADGKEIGVMAGTYKAKFTYTATSGI
ncbi:MAG: hypothetical protein ACE3L7_32755 [Candidatus Pristimantibacillus sp.]